MLNNKTISRVLGNAQEIALLYRHKSVEVEHLFYALIMENALKERLEQIGVPVNNVVESVGKLLKNKRPSNVLFTSGGFLPLSKEVHSLIYKPRENHKEDEMILNLFLDLIDQAKGELREILERYNISKESILHPEDTTWKKGVTNASREDGTVNRNNPDFLLNLTELAQKGKLPPVIGREKEILSIVRILNRERKNNPVLIGDPGVGKTAIVYGLAQKVVEGAFPELLDDVEIFQLDVILLLAETRYRGEFEGRVKHLIRFIENLGSRGVLFIDELHLIVGAGSGGGSGDMANLLKSALTSKDFRVIGATTLDEYRKYIEKDGALARRFYPIFVEEPSINETIKILEGLKPHFEEYHRVTIEEDTLIATAKLSKIYFYERRLPDSAIDLLDEACVLKKMELVNLPEELKELRKRIKNATNRDTNRVLIEKEYNAKKDHWLRSKQIDLTVRPRDVAELVSQHTNIPVGELLEKDRENLLKMEEILKKYVIGQDKAIKILSQAIRRSYAGLSLPNKPIGVFLFIGPTGVGKTLLAQQLARFLFGDEDALLRFDMSEFSERHEVAKLIGAPPGYVGYDEGGQLTEPVRRRPYRVILLDEIEKAHPNVFNIFLQVFDAGRLTDGSGRTVDFTHTVIIMTSNIGSRFFYGKNTFDTEEIIKELHLHFKPEFLNRITEIVLFNKLTKEDIEKIVKLELGKVEKMLAEKGIKLDIDTTAIKLLTDMSYSEEFGAREVERVVKRMVVNPLADSILRGELKEGMQIELFERQGDIFFKKNFAYISDKKEV